MSANTVVTSIVTGALLDMLVDAGLVAERGAVPAGAGWQGAPGVTNFVGYVVLYSIPGRTDGSIADATEDGYHSYQVTAVGSTFEQAETIADIARATVCGERPDLGSRRITLITCTTLTGVVPDDTVQPRVFMSADRFLVMSTPQSEVGS